MRNNIISANRLQTEFYLGSSRANAILNKLVELKIIQQGDNGWVFAKSYDEAVKIISDYLD